MGLFDNLNQRSTVKAGIDTTEMDFVKLGMFEDDEVMVDGFFFTDGQYGRQVVVVGNDALINMPQRAVEQFDAIKDNDKMLDAVLKGHLKLTGIKNIKLKGKNKGKTTTTYTLTEV